MKLTNPRDEQQYLLRPFKEAEAKLLSAGMSSWHVCKTITLRQAQTPQDEREWLERSRNDENGYHWAICRLDDESHDGAPIGTTSLHRLKSQPWRATTGITIFDRESWGQGIATFTHKARTMYAFDVLDIMAIDSGVLRGNPASLRALQNVGYEKVGVKYHFDCILGEVRHVDDLLLVNPSDRGWTFFWGDTTPPKAFLDARERTRESIEWARENVTFL